jgi:hypothetical protein
MEGMEIGEWREWRLENGERVRTGGLRQRRGKIKPHRSIGRIGTTDALSLIYLLPLL